MVTGANRGIGREIVRQLAERGLAVVLTARDAAAGETAASELSSAGEIHFQQLDVTDSDSVSAAVGLVERRFGRLDVLVNNAGVFLDSKEPATSVDPDVVRRTLETNTLGPIALTQRVLPVMRANSYGRVVNVTSGMGTFAEMGTGSLGYRLSKAALDAMTVIFAAELRGTGILVNAVCPGWVRTRMGGRRASRSVEEGADTAVYLATLPADGPTGGIFRDRKPISW